MSSTRDVSHLTDITKRPLEPDGTFKRRPTSFRDFIQKGGKYEPEKGKHQPRGFLKSGMEAERRLSKTATTSTFPTRAVCIPSLVAMIQCRDVGIAAWATRALIVRKLKGLEDFIGKSRA